jgi:hypothetical protein
MSERRVNERSSVIVGDEQSGLGWTVVLRRQPARIVDGLPQGDYMDVYELVCCECGDDPDRDYRQISPELQRIRGPYPIAAGIAAYQRHVRRHRRRAASGSHQPWLYSPS